MKQVDVPTLTGAFGILPAHVPTLQVLRPGVVTVFNDDGSAAKFFGKMWLDHVDGIVGGSHDLCRTVPERGSWFRIAQSQINP